MSGEKPETVHIVMRATRGYLAARPVKVADDRKDARDYAKRMNARNTRYTYHVVSCRKL